MKNEPKRDFKGIWIPKEIWLSEDLTAMEIIVWSEINSLCGEDGCFASEKYLSEFFKITTRGVRMHLQSLKKKGYLKASSFDGRKRILWTIIPTGRKTSGAPEEKLPGCPEVNLPGSPEVNMQIFYKEKKVNKKDNNIAATPLFEQHPEKIKKQNKYTPEEHETFDIVWTLFENELGKEPMRANSKLVSKSIWDMVRKKSNGNGGLAELKEMVCRFIGYVKSPPKEFSYLRGQRPLPNVMNSERTWMRLTLPPPPEEKISTPEELDAMMADMKKRGVLK